MKDSYNNLDAPILPTKFFKTRVKPTDISTFRRAKKAFTLAEVLITLAIIGVVASLTIPALIQKTQDAELLSASKKEYSVLSQAIKLFAFDNGGNLTTTCYSDDSMCLANSYKPYLKVSKVCPTFTPASQKSDCWSDNAPLLYWNPTEHHVPIILNDGAFVDFDLEYATADNDNGCNLYSAENNVNAVTACFILTVDVNGKKGPNMLNKDIFQLMAFGPDLLRAPDNNIDEFAAFMKK